ncbi:MAG: HNH endonuclease [Clostridium sp.]|nr:HNH endonuclease [Clostridium sp.]
MIRINNDFSYQNYYNLLYTKNINKNTKHSSTNPISFKSEQLEKFISEMKDLEDIHCPLCGVMTVSQEKYKKLIDEAGNIKTSQEFSKFLERNKSYMKNSFRPVIENSKEILAQTPDITADTLLHELYIKSIEEIRKAISDSAAYLDIAKQENNFSLKDQKLIDECQNALKNYQKADRSNFDINTYKELLSRIISQMESTNKWEIYEKLKFPVVEKMQSTRQFFYNKNYEFCGNREQQFIKNILKFSQSNIKQIFSEISPHIDERINYMLMCNNCAGDKKTIYKIFYSPEINQNLKVYQNDIAKKILEEKLTDFERYPLTLASFLRTATKGNVKTNRAGRGESLIALNAMIGEQQRQEIAFEPVNYSGIPCACCGKETINHKDKCKIYDEIISAKNLSEINNILQKNQSLISKRNKPLLKKIHTTLKQNPNISEAELLNILKDQTANSIKRLLIENNDRIKYLTKKYELNNNDKALVQKFTQTIEKEFLTFNNSERFPFSDYINLIKKTFFNMNTQKKFHFISLAKENIKLKYLSQSLLFPSETASEKLNSQIKIIAQNLINGGLATVDHLTPKFKHGANSIENLTVMCRDCNQEKTSYSFEYWYKLHPEIKENLQKYLYKIVEMIKEGKLKGYNSYPEKLSENVQKITAGPSEILLDYDCTINF